MPDASAYELFMQAQTLHKAGKLPDAIQLYEKARKRDRYNPSIEHYLGLALHQSGKSAEGLALMAHSVERAPSDASFLGNYGEALRSVGRQLEAVPLLERAVGLRPENPSYQLNLGVALQGLGRLEAALNAYKDCLRLKPDHPGALNNLGNVLRLMRRYDEAEKCIREAARLAPDNAMIRASLANLLLEGRRLSEAQAECAEALRLNPDLPNAWNNQGQILANLMRQREAIECYEKALQLSPDYRGASSNLLLTLNYVDPPEPTRIAKAYREWGERFCARYRRDPRPFPNSPDPQRRLRIGYMSADFREHPVAFFLEPLLRNHDREQFDITLFSTCAERDDVTEMLERFAGAVHSLVGLAPLEAADLVRSAGIDILIDLTGHTEDGRMDVLATKCAPVQGSYLGDQNTTGLPTVDFRVTDADVDPPGVDDRYAEALERLDRPFFAYSDLSRSPPVNPSAAEIDRRFTFASFTKVLKLNEATMDAWVEVLHRVPDAVLRVSGFGWDHPEVASKLFDAMRSRGVERDRFELAPVRQLGEYFQSHHELDLILDTFPFNGHTTTVHALWMGVPTVTMAGPTYASRMGLATMKAVGLDDFVAYDRAEFVKLAVERASERQRLRELRRELRPRMLASPILDGAGLARAIEAVYRRRWAKWCQPDARG
jgi:predicted O-linked N-acetylglucosamine transferase (SPINDLY family)